MTHQRTLDNLNLDGGCLCLDFINTVHDRKVSDPHDYLKSCEELLRWAEKAGIVDTPLAHTLIAMAGKDKARSAKVLVKAKALRETLHRLFRAIADQQKPDQETIAEFNGFLAPVLAGLSLKFDGPFTTRVHQRDPVDLKNPLGQVIKSAYDLLLSGNLNRVKECGACGWLFLDKSKNNSRRWCNMQNCGSAVKAKRYYQKKKHQNR